MIIALGHLMPSTPSVLSSVGECSLVCLLVHLLLWGLLWPSVWVAVEASAHLTSIGVPLLVLLICVSVIQLATSFHFGLTAPLCAAPLPFRGWKVRHCQRHLAMTESG